MSALGKALAEFGQDDAAVDRCATVGTRALLGRGVAHSAFRPTTARQHGAARSGHSISLPHSYQRSTWLLDPLTAEIYPWPSSN